MGKKVLAGRYEIIEKIGGGGMAVVYKARDKLLNRFVAIKILRPEFIGNKAFVDNFSQEAQAAASLLHPNIVTIYDVGRESDVYYIVMEYIEGMTLSELIQRSAPLDYKQAIRISKQLASALSLAHRNNIIHRDVKPANILLTSDGTAKIADFGIARGVSDGTIMNERGVIMGSVHYFSPEQSRGMYVDEKSDIYSLGIVIYEMLTGRVPFDADDPVTIAVMHMNNSIIPPSKLVDGIPPGLDQIVMKATAKLQSDRFSNIEEMYQALDSVNFITGVLDGPIVAGALVAEGAAGEYGDAVPYDGGGASDEEFEERSYDDFTDFDDETLTVPPLTPPGDEDWLAGPEARDEEKEGGGMDKKKKNKNNGNKPGWFGRLLGKTPGGPVLLGKYKALAIVLGILLAAGAGFGLSKGISYLTTDKLVKVPDVIGQTEEAGTKKMKAAGFKVKIEKVDAERYEEYEQYKVGDICSQDPLGGSQIVEGSTVTLIVAAGEGEEETVGFTGQVPNLVGKTKASAEYTIAIYGYKPGSITYADGDEAPDTVIKQNPPAGSSLDRNAKIDLVISRGKNTAPRQEENKERTQVPNFAGRSLADAQAAAAGANLSITSIGEEYNSSYAAGQIFWQSAGAGTQVDVGTVIQVKVSKGPEPPPPPVVASKSVTISGLPSSCPADNGLLPDDPDYETYTYSYAAFMDGIQVQSGGYAGEGAVTVTVEVSSAGQSVTVYVYQSGSLGQNNQIGSGSAAVPYP
ncbi:MAG: Stk1 family PASTA domain-containing Ser/Thr kinase [Clostridiales Family XIII bacterium]|jgi:serine/threonine-protein kinase|nr:Stk1 family PASTA domain-containing Ser/Thr kinase [Clostridiales Family XIII bacterium]